MTWFYSELDIITCHTKGSRLFEAEILVNFYSGSIGHSNHRIIQNILKSEDWKDVPLSAECFIQFVNGTQLQVFAEDIRYKVNPVPEGKLTTTIFGD